jgi:diacylglycerol O-acyltransferase
MSNIAYDNKMSDAEGLMWRLEKDPHLSSTFASVTILDRKPDFDLLRERMIRSSHRMPRLRQRVQTAPGNMSAPTWVEDSDFDIGLHLRRVALPKPGTERQLFDLATLLCAEPFDRTRPLWQFTVVEGLKGNRAALIQKLHHTIADGESGVKLSLEFLDFERDAVQPVPLTPDDIAAATEDLRNDDTTAADAVRDVLAGSMRLPLGILKQVKELLSDPSQIPDASSAAANTFRGIVNQLGDTDPARSPLWTQRSTRRTLVHSVAPFDATKAAAKRLGGTLNTAFLTIATDAASAYHVEQGSPVQALRASMAISTRTETSGANAFSLVRMLVPSGEMSLDERFRAIDEATTEAVGATGRANLDSMAAVAAGLPTSLLTRMARQQSQTVDFATSNVRGAPMPLYVAGAQLLHNIPVGPLSGVAFNLTLLSYHGNLDMGLNIDAAAVDDPALLKRCLDDAIERMTQCAKN